MNQYKLWTDKRGQEEKTRCDSETGQGSESDIKKGQTRQTMTGENRQQSDRTRQRRQEHQLSVTSEQDRTKNLEAVHDVLWSQWKTAERLHR